eukprot:COSAG02_NODE_59626_length_273_cov_4.885057_1_plen_79_part_01
MRCNGASRMVRATAPPPLPICIKALPTYVASKVTASAVRLVRKRKVLVLNGQSRPKRPKNGLYQGHTARASVGTSTSEA